MRKKKIKFYSPLKAFLLSLVLPGGGYFYLRQPVRGSLCLVPGLVLEGVIIKFYSAIFTLGFFEAIQRAKDNNQDINVIIYFAVWISICLLPMSLVYSAINTARLAVEKNYRNEFMNGVSEAEKLKSQIEEIKNKQRNW